MAKHPLTTNIEPFYHAWYNMKQRCDNDTDPSYRYYGARGIDYPIKWEVFEGFIEDMLDGWRPGLTLDRKDNNGNYSKENCRWISHQDNLRNSRYTKLTLDKARAIRGLYAAGELSCYKLGKIFGVKWATIRDVIKGRTWQE